MTMSSLAEGGQGIESVALTRFESQVMAHLGRSMTFSHVVGASQDLRVLGRVRQSRQSSVRYLMPVPAMEESLARIGQMDCSWS